MFAPPATFRVVSAVLSVAIGTTLMLAKAHYSDEYNRLTSRGDVVVLPAAEVVGVRSVTSLAAAADDARVN
jgi:hypothetical protein